MNLLAALPIKCRVAVFGALPTRTYLDTSTMQVIFWHDPDFIDLDHLDQFTGPARAAKQPADEVSDRPCDITDAVAHLELG
jgi:hypothetical protein